MIFYYLMKLLTLIGTLLQSVFGRVDSLPFGTDAPISEYWAMFLYITEQFWPLQGILTILSVYLTWRVSIMIYKKFFGSRAVIN